jgi:hypothetical protein
VEKRVLDLLLHAEEFRRAGIRLEGDGTIDRHVLMPLMVCNAFALELYLKFLIWAGGKEENPYGHSLKDLFKKLPDDALAAIRKAWNRPSPYHLQLRAMTVQVTGKKWPSLEEMVEESSDAFQRLRYSYSYPDNANYWRAGELLGAARSACFDLHPDASEARLPLPPGAIPLSRQTAKHVKFDPPPWKKGRK